VHTFPRSASHADNHWRLSCRVGPPQHTENGCIHRAPLSNVGFTPWRLLASPVQTTPLGTTPTRMRRGCRASKITTRGGSRVTGATAEEPHTPAICCNGRPVIRRRAHQVPRSGATEDGSTSVVEGRNRSDRARCQDELVWVGCVGGPPDARGGRPAHQPNQKELRPAGLPPHQPNQKELRPDGETCQVAASGRAHAPTSAALFAARQAPSAQSLGRGQACGGGRRAPPKGTPLPSHGAQTCPHPPHHAKKCAHPEPQRKRPRCSTARHKPTPPPQPCVNIPDRFPNVRPHPRLHTTRVLAMAPARIHE